MNAPSVPSAARPEDIGQLGERFVRDLAAIVERPFWAMLDEQVGGLVALVEECGGTCRALFDEVGALAAREGFDTADERRAFLDAADAARKTHAERIRALLEADEFRATGWRGEDIFDALLRAADAVADGYPEVLRTPQEDARFQPDPSDPLRIRTVRAAKRVVRPTRREWTRRVPAAAAARFHASGRFPARIVAVYSGVRRLRVLTLVEVHGAYRIAFEGMAAIRRKALDDASAAELGAEALEAGARLREHVDGGTRRLRRTADQMVSALDAVVRDVGAAFQATLGRVGTLEQLAGSVSSSRQWKLLAGALAEQRRMSARWDEYEASLRETLDAEVEFARVGAAMYGSSARALAGIQESIDQHLTRPIESLRATLAEAGAQAMELFGHGSDRTATSELSRVHSDVEQAFARQGAWLGEPAHAPRDIRRHLDALAQELSALATEVPDTSKLFPGRPGEIPETPEDLARRKAPLRKLASAFCNRRLPRQLAARAGVSGPELDRIRADVERLRRGIDFNIASAAQALTVESAPTSTQAGELVTGVLHRGERQLEELRGSCEAAYASLRSAVARQTAEAAERMLELVADGDVLAMRAEILDEETSRSAASAVAFARRGSARVRVVARGVRIGWDRIGPARVWVRGRIGLQPPESTERSTSLDQSVLEPSLTVTLPHAYQQVFASAPLEWDQFLVGRENELATIATAYGRWKGGDASAVAVHGEQGSGKTTLLRAARRRILADSPVRSLTLRATVRSEHDLVALLAPLFDVDDTGTLSDLADRVLAQEPTAVFLEDAHRLFLRTVGGFDVLRSFLGFLAATKGRVFWVITLDHYAWTYLLHVFGVREHFEFTIDTTTLPGEQLEAMILARHDVTGYHVRFDVDENTARSRRFRQLAVKRSDQEAARALFFEELSKIAAGNVALGLFYWLRSIAAMDEQTLVIQMPAVVPAALLATLPLPTFHTIAAVILHGGLTADAHAAAFQLSPEESRRALSTMVDSRLLFLSDDGQYKANKVLYRPYVRLLRSKNIF